MSFAVTIVLSTGRSFGATVPAWLVRVRDFHRRLPPDSSDSVSFACRDPLAWRSREPEHSFRRQLKS